MKIVSRMPKIETKVFNLLVSTDECHVSKVVVLLQLPKGRADVGLKLVPLKEKLLSGAHLLHFQSITSLLG